MTAVEQRPPAVPPYEGRHRPEVVFTNENLVPLDWNQSLLDVSADLLNSIDGGVATLPSTELGITNGEQGRLGRLLPFTRARKAGNAAVRITANSEALRDSHNGFDYRLITDEKRLKLAGIVEQDVWDENGYGKLEEEGYGKYNEHSRVFGAFEGEDCVGMTRMFRATEETLVPFLDESMPYNDEQERQAIIDRAIAGEVEELGTAAVIQAVRGKGVSSHLWRLAYRDAVRNGVQAWGIIMEPERVQKDLNGAYGFTFRQLGPAVHYQGGDCAAHIMELSEAKRNMLWKHLPSLYWFTKRALKA